MAGRGAGGSRLGGMDGAPSRPITFMSDFGTDDEFVGVVHGVIATLAPRCRVIDLNHRIPRGDVRSGALALLRAIQYMPPGVILAVVDPGVGSGRRAIVLDTQWGHLGMYRTRKLWLVNGLHAASAFLGLQAGHETIAQAVSDPGIRTRLEEMLETMAAVLSSESGERPGNELADYGRSNLERFSGAALVDPVRRVARNPLIKLGATERLVGPARAAARSGLPVGALCDAIVAGLSLRDGRVDGVDDLARALDGSGWESVLGLEAGEPLAKVLKARMAQPAS